MFIPKNPNKDKKIIIFSGAGLDAPSGISTFRGANGLWNNHKITDVCTQSTWKKNFELVHEFYNERRVELKDKEINDAHLAIKRIYETYGEDNVYNITMNVSDFFERLEVPTLHVHGELTKMECEACGQNWDTEYNEFNLEFDRCPHCDSLKGARPKIVFFGGSAPMYSYMWRAFEATMNPDTIVVVIGTQGNVVNVDENLRGTLCKKILCNMESSPDINENIYDEVYLESIIDAMPKIEKNIQEWWS